MLRRRYVWVLALAIPLVSCITIVRENSGSSVKLGREIFRESSGIDVDKLAAGEGGSLVGQWRFPGRHHSGLRIEAGDGSIDLMPRGDEFDARDPVTSTVTYTRPAGIVTLEPGEDNSGRFRFEPNDEFAKEWLRISGSPAGTIELLRLAAANVPLDAPAAYEEAGLEHLSPRAMARLTNYGVTPEYARGMIREGGIAPSAEGIQKLKQYGVSVDYAKSLADGSVTVTADDVIRLRNYGVPAEYAVALMGEEYGLSIDDTLRMRNYGIPVEYYREMQGLGGEYAQPDKILEMRNYGIPTAFIREVGKCGDFGPDDVKKFRNYGVPADFICAVSEAGYSNDADTVTRFRQNGISTDFIKACNPPGKDPVPADELIKLRQHGVSAETIRRLRE